ncbi:MAG: serine protease [Myxococcota bacterium]|nr:serine protease [Myxococcota bacterium]
MFSARSVRHRTHEFRVAAIVRALPAMIAIAISAPAAAQIVTAGEHFPIDLDTPHEYSGLVGPPPKLEWSDVIHHPGATYISIHFSNFNLGEGDHVVVSDLQGGQRYVIGSEGKLGHRTFWAQHIKGDAALIQLFVTSDSGGSGFVIDEYVAGTVDLGAPPRRSEVEPQGPQPEAICGLDDKRNAVCYQGSHPTEYARGRAVARLLINGSSLCTGWLVSSDNLLLTNEHCITSDSAALNTDYEFAAEASNCGDINCLLCHPGTVYSGGTLLQDNANLDYALIEVTSGDPASVFGHLEIDDRVAVVGEEIYILQHPGGRAKEFAIVSTHPSDVGGIPRVNSITTPPCSGSGYFDVGYFADTEGGSSGSPVMARSSHKVIALHHCANCPNRGVPIHLVYDEIRDFLQGSAGSVALDHEAYGCTDIATVTVVDGDLAGTVLLLIEVETTGGDAEFLILVETAPGSAEFEGSIPLTTGVVVPGDGNLQVSEGHVISAIYEDADDGTGNPATVIDTADVDCTFPVISNVAISEIGATRATTTFDTDEEATGTALVGLVCGISDGSFQEAPTTSHAIEMTGLLPSTTYYVSVEAEDAARNTSTDDNGGACYAFTTLAQTSYVFEWFCDDPDACTDPGGEFSGQIEFDEDGFAPGGTFTDGTGKILSFNFVSTIPGGDPGAGPWDLDDLVAANPLSDLTWTFSADGSTLVNLGTASGSTQCQGQAPGDICFATSGDALNVNEDSVEDVNNFTATGQWGRMITQLESTVVSFSVEAGLLNGTYDGSLVRPADAVNLTTGELAFSAFPDTILEDIDAFHVMPDGSVVFSTSTDVTQGFGGLAIIRNGDLVLWDGVEATLLFSEMVGFGSPYNNIDAFSMLPNGNWLLSTDLSATLGGLSFQNGDIVEYDPDADVATLHEGLDESTIFTGEPNSNADIDALHANPNGTVIFSIRTDGIGRVGNGPTYGFADAPRTDLFQIDPASRDGMLFLEGDGLFDGTARNLDAVFVGVIENASSGPPPRPVGCGLGAEVGLLMPLLTWWHRRRRRRTA